MNQSKNKPSAETLLSIIRSLKSDHQKNIFKLSKENERLQQEISVLKKKSVDDDENIKSLRAENETLTLRLREHECKASATKSQSNHNNTKNIYDVEKILADKMINKTKHYLVRWEGFDENHDSWEPRRNLQCGEKLRKYEQSKRKK